MNPTDPKHATVRTIIENEDGSTTIDTKKYYEKLSLHEVQSEYKQQTDAHSYLADTMDALRLIKDKQTKCLTIEIVTDEYFQPKMIVKKYTTFKESYSRR